MPRAALRIQDKYDKGWRKEAAKLGQIFDVERNGEIVMNNQNFKISAWERNLDIEMDRGISWTYRVRGSRRNLLVGDVLIGKDVASKRQNDTTKEVYTIVSLRLLRDNIAARTDRIVNIFRPDQQNPITDTDPDYSYQNINNGLILARNLTTNLWSFIPQIEDGDYEGAGYSTQIRAGVTFGRSGEYHPDSKDLPFDSPNTGWTITCGLLEGVILQENDEIRDIELPELNWFRVDRAYRQTNSAFVYQLRCTKMRT